jgi:threonine synthase
MSFVDGLRCTDCGRESPAQALHVCDFCFAPLEVSYDIEAAAATLSPEAVAAGPPSLWRYAALLPASAEGRVDLGAGFTPLIRADRLAAELGLGELWLKNDTVNPTGSFKDRVVSVALTKARELGFKVAACSSTGNLGNAVAAHAARAGMRAVIFIPQDLEPVKIAASAVYGATVVPLDGTYDDAARLCSELIEELDDWAFVNNNLRTYYSEGSKTLAFEIAEQLGWQVPDHVVVPVASGSQLTKVHKGFTELGAVGLISGELPRLSGAQASGCNPVAAAFAAGDESFTPVRRPHTVAKSLAIGNPTDGDRVLAKVRATGGAVGEVNDAEILESIKLLARTEGVFAETAGGVTVGVLAKLAAAGTIRRDERVVAIISGNGLKTIESLAPTLERRRVVKPSLDAVLANLEEVL